ncbi:mechanosensitive ion channel family protein, partial [Candidatus Omnitrophota bacterium]
LSVSKFLIWGLAIIFFLDNLGFKVSTVIAGLGIGGVAVALAAQAVLGDLFSYFAIIFDRPFEIGDFIIIGEYLGTIEHIGVKTTRIRSLGGEQLVFSNTDLTNSRVRNYKRMQKRRVVFKLGVTYQTSLDQLKAVPGIIEKAIKSIDNTTFDRAHFLSYGDFSLVLEVVYYVLTGDYNKYMDIQQSINFAIKEEFEKRGIEFAYPTQTLYVNKTSA